MYREMMRVKIAYPTITQTELFYEGSITVDETIMKAVDLREHEKVDILNVNNGERLQTYVIKGTADSGVICLNGPAARKACPGDKIVIIAYRLCEESELDNHESITIKVDEQNRITDTTIWKQGS